jgi:hypothetical protein
MQESLPCRAVNGLDWQFGGFAADQPPGSTGASNQVGHLLQAMAGFDGDVADASNGVFLGADPSQQRARATLQYLIGTRPRRGGFLASFPISKQNSD